MRALVGPVVVAVTAVAILVAMAIRNGHLNCEHLYQYPYGCEAEGLSWVFVANSALLFFAGTLLGVALTAWFAPAVERRLGAALMVLAVPCGLLATAVGHWNPEVNPRVFGLLCSLTWGYLGVLALVLGTRTSRRAFVGGWVGAALLAIPGIAASGFAALVGAAYGCSYDPSEGSCDSGGPMIGALIGGAVVGAIFFGVPGAVIGATLGRISDAGAARRGTSVANHPPPQPGQAPQPGQVRCLACGEWVETRALPAQATCASCGTPLFGRHPPRFLDEPWETRCPSCNRPTPPERWICYFCNTNLSGTPEHATQTNSP